METQPTGGASLEEQTQQLIQVEQQPTLPMVIPQTPREYAVDALVFDVVEEREQVEQQPTQLIEQREMPAILPARPVSMPGRQKTLRMELLGLFYALLIGSAIVGHAALANWFGVVVSPVSVAVQTNVVPGIIIHPHPNPTTASAITTAAQSFMREFMRKQWATLWSMLSPDAQRLFNGESDFTHFERAKFGTLTLLSYRAGVAELVQPWLDPDSIQVFPLAGVVHISLDASGSLISLSPLSIADLRNGLFHTTTLALIPHNGQWQVVLAGPADLDAPILVPASPPATRLLVPIFMYHHVSNAPTTNALDYSLTVTATDFNAQLDWLQQQGYDSINMTELFDSLYYGKALPPRPMILSFDDGYEDVFTGALPALLAHHYRGVFYIITGMIGGWYMTWNQVRILQDEGMQIASHTIHHVNIGQPPYYTSTQAELVQSKTTLQQQLGIPIQFFCYPTGEPFHHDSLAEQQVVLQDLFNDGYIGATLDPFAFDSAVQNAQTPYQLPRVRVSGGEPLSAYIGILTSVLTSDAQQIAS
jgi:peptidoglycan/xylan/chitin deacetylase (PgdA/CDA1 family)